MVSSTPRPHFIPGKELVPILQEAGWASGPVWTGGISRPHRDSIPDRPARSQSLYRLSYPAHKMHSANVKIITRKFGVLLTVHLSIFILRINQIDAQNLFYSKFISCLYMFRAPCAHRQEVKIVLYSTWYHHTCRCSKHVQA